LSANRTIGFLRKQMTNDEQATENHSLYLFLAPQNSITMNLKTELQQINGYTPLCSSSSSSSLRLLSPVDLCTHDRSRPSI